jgi:Uma2 family endonuclease
MKASMNNIFTPPKTAVPASQRGEPTWEVAMLFPAQGHWTEEEYLALDTNRLVEFVDGLIELQPRPALTHQLILGFLLRWFDDFVTLNKLGLVLLSPFPVKIAPGKYRQPDLLFLKPGRLKGANPRSVLGADLALEIVSAGAENRKRDLETKPDEYTAAGISEYWLVDPEQQTITVLTLDGTAYREHGVFRIGDLATSVLLAGLTLSVADTFAAGKQGT